MRSHDKSALVWIFLHSPSSLGILSGRYWQPKEVWELKFRDVPSYGASEVRKQSAKKCKKKKEQRRAKQVAGLKESLPRKLRLKEVSEALGRKSRTKTVFLQFQLALRCCCARSSIVFCNLVLAYRIVLAASKCCSAFWLRTYSSVSFCNLQLAAGSCVTKSCPECFDFKRNHKMEVPTWVEEWDEKHIG